MRYDARAKEIAREPAMLRRPTHLVLALTALAAASTAGASELGAAVDGGAGIGVDLTRLDRELTLAGDTLAADGSLAGVHAYWQRGAGIRLSGALQGGSVEYSTGGVDQSESAVYGDLAATFGWNVSATRAFIGLGAEAFTTDSPFGDGARSSASLYLPFGLARARRIHPDWYGKVRVEARFVLAGSEQIDDVTGMGDLDLTREGGWGLEVGAQLQHIDAPITAEPYLRYVVPSDTETERSGGVAVRAESMEYLAGGVRLTWQY